MCPVDTTVSFTHASTRPGLEGAVRRAATRLSLRWVRALVWVLALACLAGPVMAREPEIQFVSLQRNAEALTLSVRLGSVATAAVEDALLKGVPMYFVWQADVYRDRWYWTDKRVSSMVRTFRLAYQPLTRRWRLSQAHDGVTGSGAAALQYALHQNFESLDEVLAVVGRVSGWAIADAARLDDGAQHRVEWRFSLDLSLLPRPFQIGMANQSDWNIEVDGRLNVPHQAKVDPPPPDIAVEVKPGEAAR
jgi:hypothetical protein